ncbi:Fc.00g064530.m01.CDS01 [Cosmosporella sp. VM-42]
MARKSLRILCFGDSLTSGYCNWGMHSHPYSIKLQERLQQAFPHVDIDIVTNGAPGDVASFERFEKRIKNEYEKNFFFDWAIILGGTNDLGYGISAAKIYQALQTVWSISISKGSKVLALTVPECESKSERLVQRRDELNLNILTHQEPNYYFFDLESKIPFHALSQADREKYWDDGLHLRDDGYDWMGDHIADGLIRIIRREGDYEPPDLTTKKPSTKRRDDGLSFDEEDGNPKNISEGYVVVRKRDLD